MLDELMPCSSAAQEGGGDEGSIGEVEGSELVLRVRV